MKIRFDFITNSSSTSFVVICKGWPERELFLVAMGVKTDSRVQPFFDELYTIMKAKAENARDAIHGRGYWEPAKDVATLIRCNLSDETAKRAKRAIRKGEDVWIGTLRSEGGTVESFFCCDSFEVDHPDCYINALRSSW